ncbi:MAG TPA: nuclear transport factor 2 family protein [Fimbriimonadaceae bacterium]|nr:nuclear transport factor 2 family protein [Fimbriimonadaceae bacterium]
MKRILVLAVVSVAALSLAQQKTGAQRIIEKQMAGYVKAMETKDVRGVMAILAPTFSATDAKGVVHNRERVVIQLKSLFATAKTIHVVTKIKSFKLEKGVAHLTTTNVLEVDIPAGKTKMTKYRSDSVNDEAWVPTNGTWKIQSSKTVTEKQLVDGKPIG